MIFLLSPYVEVPYKQIEIWKILVSYTFEIMVKIKFSNQDFHILRLKKTWETRTTKITFGKSHICFELFGVK